MPKSNTPADKAHGQAVFRSERNRSEVFDKTVTTNRVRSLVAGSILYHLPIEIRNTRGSVFVLLANFDEMSKEK